MFTKDQQIAYQLQKEKAIYYASENRLDEAFDLCLDLLQTNPNDPEIAKIMGDFFIVARGDHALENVGNMETQAGPGGFQLEPVDPDEQTSDDFLETAAAVPTSPEAVRELLQTLTQRVVPVSEEELLHAAQVLQEIVSSPRPAVEVAKRLDEIDSLLPALIDLNIRQARMDGRPDLATGLAYLKTNINLQKSMAETSLDAKCQPGSKSYIPVEKFTGKVAIFQPDESRLEENNRMRLLKSALFSTGNLISVEETENLTPDVALFSNPFLDGRLMEKMAAYSAVGIPVILDLEQADGQATMTAMSRGKVNASLQSLNKAYASALILSDLITVSSPVISGDLVSSGYLVIHVANGWSTENPYWSAKTGLSETTVRLGWFGSSGRLEDLALIRRPLIRLLREFEHKLRLVIVDDQAAYKMFEKDAEDLVTFYPCLSHNEIPYIMDQMDVLLMPARGVSSFQKQSDDLLMYAGVKKIPWAASPVLPVLEWKNGGVVCGSPEEWHNELRHLILDKELRQALGMSGFQASSRREMLIHIHQWYNVFSQAVELKKNPDETIKFSGCQRGEL